MPIAPALTGLTAFSQRFASHLLQAFPALRDHARNEAGALVVELPCPVDERRSLTLATDDDELGMGFDMWHAHIGDGISEARDFDVAVQLIDDLFHERVFVAVRFRAQQFLDARLIKSLEDLQNEEPEPGEELFIRSWHGSHDARFRAASAAELPAKLV